jgi:antitoxin PrlF
MAAPQAPDERSTRGAIRAHMQHDRPKGRATSSCFLPPASADPERAERMALRGQYLLSNTNLKCSLTGGSMTTTVTSKGQVTIPKRVRELLGIGPGSVIDFERGEDGRVVLVKVGRKSRPNRFARLRGHAGKGLSTDEIMALTRGER